MSGCGCQICGKTFSKKEKELFNYIETIAGETNIIQNDRTVLNGQEIDILLPNHNIAFEYNGLFWHSNIKKHKDYHLNKTILCNSKNIKLIHIFEDDWLYKEDACKKLINDLLIDNNQDIVIKPISQTEAIRFHEKYSLYKTKCGKINFGIFTNKKLIDIISLTMKAPLKYELLSFSHNQTIFNKTIEYIKNNIKFEVLIINADISFQSNILCENNSFTKLKTAKPKHYFILNDKRITENIKKEKLNKIYDCGTIKMQYTL